MEKKLDFSTISILLLEHEMYVNSFLLTNPSLLPFLITSLAITRL